MLIHADRQAERWTDGRPNYFSRRERFYSYVMSPETMKHS